MDEMIERLIARCDAIRTKQRSLLDSVGAADRDLTPAEKATFDEQQADVETMTKRVAELQEIQRRNAHNDAQRGPYEAALNNYGRARDMWGEDLGPEGNMNLTDVEMRDWCNGKGILYVSNQKGSVVRADPQTTRILPCRSGEHSHARFLCNTGGIHPQFTFGGWVAEPAFGRVLARQYRLNQALGFRI